MHSRKPAKSLEEYKNRFFAKTEPAANGCIVWTGARFANGYGSVLRLGKRCKAHRIAWEFEHGPIPEGLLVRHVICRNPPCVNVQHLLTGTQYDNMQDMKRDGTAAKGDNSGPRKRPEKLKRGFEAPGTKLREEDIKNAFVWRKEGLTLREIAVKLEVGETTISNLISGRNWQHLKLPVEKRAVGNLTLTRLDIECILRRLADGEQQRDIARSYQVTQGTVSRIKNGKHCLSLPGDVS